MGFDELIVSCGTGHDDMGCDTGLIFADSFEYTFTLFGRWCAVAPGWAAKDNDCVEVDCGGVVRRDGDVDANEEESVGEDDYGDREKDSVE